MNSALTLDITKSQWVDLGYHTEACMTQPETCGAAGGALSLWVNLIDCNGDRPGIISSCRTYHHVGVIAVCKQEQQGISIR